MRKKVRKKKPDNLISRERGETRVQGTSRPGEYAKAHRIHTVVCGERNGEESSFLVCVSQLQILQHLLLVTLTLLVLLSQDTHRSVGRCGECEEFRLRLITLPAEWVSRKQGQVEGRLEGRGGAFVVEQTRYVGVCEGHFLVRLDAHDVHLDRSSVQVFHVSSQDLDLVDHRGWHEVVGGATGQGSGSSVV